MVENNLKIFIENNHLRYFLNTNIGREFIEEEKCINVYKNEKPDYIFETLTGNIGFELTILAENTVYASLFHSLSSIVNKVFKRIDKELKYKYFLNLICLENDIDKIFVKEKELAEQIFTIIANREKKEITPKKIKYSIGPISIKREHNIEEIVTINGLRFKLIFSKHDEKYNFGGTPIFSPLCEDPINLIQSVINKKEAKKSKYNICKKCCLLIISDPFIAKGNSYSFSDKMLEYTFNSSFDDIFLLELGGKNNVRVIKLKLKQNILGNKNAK